MVPMRGLRSFRPQPPFLKSWHMERERPVAGRSPEVGLPDDPLLRGRFQTPSFEPVSGSSLCAVVAKRRRARQSKRIEFFICRVHNKDKKISGQCRVLRLKTIAGCVRFVRHLEIRSPRGQKQGACRHRQAPCCGSVRGISAPSCRLRRRFGGTSRRRRCQGRSRGARRAVCRRRPAARSRAVH